MIQEIIAALKFADIIGRALHFHINIGRVEMKGDPILHNLRGLFEGIAENGHQLIIHTWAPHAEFIKIIKDIDIGVQVSFSETFNIVAADMVVTGVPIVVSSEIPWAREGIADPTDSHNIANIMEIAWKNMNSNVKTNLKGLKTYVRTSKEYWIEFLERTSK